MKATYKRNRRDAAQLLTQLHKSNSKSMALPVDTAKVLAHHLKRTRPLKRIVTDDGWECHRVGVVLFAPHKRLRNYMVASLIR